MKIKMRQFWQLQNRVVLRLNLGLVVVIIWAQACGNFQTNSAGGGNTTTSTPNNPTSTPSSPTGSPTSPTNPAPVGRYRDPKLNNFGTNISGVVYYGDNAIFADMMLSAQGSNGRWSANGAEVPLDQAGDPTIAAQASVTSNYPTGSYDVSWDGTGTLTLVNSSDTLSAPIVTMVNGVQHNTAILSHTQQNGSWITFSTSPPTTNIHALAPSSLTYPNSYFLTQFITRLKPFTTLRFMDAQGTNGSTISNWSQRTWPTQGSRAAAGGFAYEDIIAIANLLVADVWVNVPVQATDDYVCRMARLFKYGEAGDKLDTTCDPNSAGGTATTTPLNVTSHLYVEYSNELWGGIPPNRQAVQNMATGGTCPSAIAAAALANTSIPWAADAYTKTSQLIKVLEKRTSDIIKTVFGSSKSQIKFVLAIQYVWSDGSTPGFEFALSQFGDLSQVFDCVGTAPYFQVDNSQTDNLNDIFANISSVWLNPDPATPSSIAGFITSNLAFAQKYNLTLISYEGGQALSSSTNPNLIVAAQNDPRMYAMYQTYIGLWNSIVGHDHLFTHFTDVSAQYGNNSWGLLVHENDPGSQKWDALMSLSQIPGDANYDGVVDSQDCEILQSNFGQTGTWWAEGDFNHDGVVDAKDLAILNASAPNLNCAITD